jgi:predicted nucleic acid-binding protein
MVKRAFIDTSFIVAALSISDTFHDLAIKQSEDLFSHYEVWISDAILFEVGNAFSKVNKNLGAGFIESCFEEADTHLIHTDPELFSQAVSMYTQYVDKKWSLTDCLSFIVMKENEISIAFSSDHHYEQAGFQYTLK